MGGVEGIRQVRTWMLCLAFTPVVVGLLLFALAGIGSTINYQQQSGTNVGFYLLYVLMFAAIFYGPGLLLTGIGALTIGRTRVVASIGLVWNVLAAIFLILACIDDTLNRPPESGGILVQLSLPEAIAYAVPWAAFAGANIWVLLKVRRLPRAVT